VRTQLLDYFGIRLAVCNCLYGVQLVFDAYMARAFARAVNNWIAKEWLDPEPRLRASIVVPLQDPEFAVEEIERCAPDAGSSYRHPVTSVGWPTTYAEEYASQAQGFQAQLTSLITEGVFRTGRAAAGAGRQRCERLVDAFGPRLGSRPFWSTASHAAGPACWRKRPSPT
jgi:uncharacterized protein